MRKAFYRAIENTLCSYIRDSLLIKKYQAELDQVIMAGDVKCQQYSQEKKVGGNSDPVACHVDKIIALERKIYKLSTQINAIDRLREDLKNETVITLSNPANLLLILNEYYINVLRQREFLRMVRWSRAIFYARRNELIIIAGNYLRPLQLPRVSKNTQIG